MRLKNKPWSKQFIADNDHLFITNEIDFNEFVINKQACLEIGCGKGKFIRQLALENPNINYIALEKYESVIVMAAKPLIEDPLPNLKFMQTDVIELQKYKKIDDVFNKIYLNFSDPWPKMRHYKRRLTFDTYLNLYEKMLNNDGVLIQKTDNKSLFEFSIESLSKNNWQLSNISLDLHSTQRENIMTEFEEKFSNRGLTINYLEARKVNNEY